MHTLGLAPELNDRELNFEVIPHAPTGTAAAEAQALGVAPAQVGKTVVLHTGAGYVRAVVPASRRLDLQRVRHVLGDKHARLATETELAAAYPMFELGATPPLGGPSGDRVLLDTRVAAHELVIVEAGTHDESVRIRTSALQALTDAVVADICLR
jgi:Ala-tRNA(Pro) deacylase